MIEMAIVGLGAWGLCVLERTVRRAWRVRTPVRVHVVEPAQLGGGVYCAEQPDFLKRAQPYPAPDEALDKKMQDLWTEMLQSQ